MVKKAPPSGPPADEREKGTREDGEAMPPSAGDPRPGGKPETTEPTGKGIPPLPEPNIEGVGKESGPSAGKTGLKGERKG
jgi:hypothetical protein